MKKSAALFFLCLTFARCVFADTAITNDNLIVAFQFLDDQWIQDAQAYTGEYARVYKNSLNVNTPPSYGVYTLNDNGMPVYSSVSQLQMWNYLSVNSSSFVDYIRDDGDGLGEYVRVSSLANLGTYFISYITNNVTMTPKDYTVVSNARRLSTLSVAQSPAEISAISNATCNCDWTIVTNIYTTVQQIKNGNEIAFETLNGNVDNIYKWLTGFYGVGNGYPYSFPDWLDLILTNTTSSISWDQITNFFANVEKMGWDGYQVQNLLLGYDFPSILEALNDYNLWGGVEFNYDMARDFNSAFSDYNEYATDRYNFITRIVKNQAYANLIGSMSMMNAFSLYDWLYNFTMPIQTNQSNIATALFTGDIQDKYSYLTNLYADLADANHSMPYTDRLELLLAALVFAGDAQADTNQTSFSDAETNAEDIKTQYVSLVNQLNQTILGDVKSNIERTDRSLLSFFQTLNSALDFQYQPNIHIEHNVDSNFGTDSLPNGFGIGDYWEFDLESNGVDTFIKFCRACTSIVILSGWLFIVWQLGRGTAKICWRMAVLAFKTSSKLLG